MRSAATTPSPIVPGPITTTRSPARFQRWTACSPMDIGSARTARFDATDPIAWHCDSCATRVSPQPPPTASLNPIAGDVQATTPASSNRSHVCGYPAAQVRHGGSNPLWTQLMTGSTTTRSPGASVATPGPTESTTATTSWPGTRR